MGHSYQIPECNVENEMAGVMLIVDTHVYHDMLGHGD